MINFTLDKINGQINQQVVIREEYFVVEVLPVPILTESVNIRTVGGVRRCTVHESHMSHSFISLEHSSVSRNWRTHSLSTPPYSSDPIFN